MKTRLNIRGLQVPPSIVLARAAQDRRLTDCFNVTFEVWPNTEKMHADIASNLVDLCILPTNLSGSLYNEGLPLRLLCINVWGLLHVMSAERTETGWRSLAGGTVAIPLKGNMPDTIFSVLINQNGIECVVRYCDTYGQAAAALLSKEVQFAVLPEPFASESELKGAYRALDLQEAWAGLNSGVPRYPQAGAVILGSTTAATVELVVEVLEDALEWLVGSADEAGVVGTSLLGIDASIITASVNATRWQSLRASAARSELERFYKILLTNNPQVLSLGLPDENFYAI